MYLGPVYVCLDTCVFCQLGPWPKQTFPDGHAVPGEAFIVMINEMAALITVISAAYDTALAEVTEQSDADHDALTVFKFWPNLHTQSMQLI